MYRRGAPPSLSPSLARPPPSPAPVGASRPCTVTTAGRRGSGRAEPAGQGAEPREEGAGQGDSVAALLTSLEPLRLREPGVSKWPPQPSQEAPGGPRPSSQALRRTWTRPAPSCLSQAPPTAGPQAGPSNPGAPAQAAPADPDPAPDPAPARPLFSLRSSGGAQGKRGNTITITPRRPPAGPGAVGAATPTPAGCTVTITPRGAPAPTPNGTAAGAAAGDGGKKRYPTAEEIQVIGGYESLGRSCLAKQRRQHRGSKVCFDETRLEQVCEYPSESAWLACFPCPSEPIVEKGKSQARGAEDDEEEEEEEARAFGPGSVRIARPESGRMLRVDESCRR